MRFSHVGDSYSRWLRMGSPQAPSAEQIAALRQASGLKSAGEIPAPEGRLGHTLDVPKHQAVLCEIVP